MKKVITYGTFDLLHHGHLNILRKAKELGDYLIVGVTNDVFDKERGKLNVQNNVLERVEAVRATGIADEIIIENYVGQKIDDILRLNIDIFAIGSDWEGQFDYLNEFCKVVYIPRTTGISSTMLRTQKQRCIKVGVIGAGRIAERFASEAHYVNCISLNAIYDKDLSRGETFAQKHEINLICKNVETLLDSVDAVYIATPHLTHYEYIKKALNKRKHVLCETPMVLSAKQAEEVFNIATEKECILLEANKTAYCPAFNHLLVMIKSGVIGQVVDVEASLSKLWKNRQLRELDPEQAGGSLYELGSYPLLPIIKLMGAEYKEIKLFSRWENDVDIYTKGIIRYDKALCSFKVGLGIKTEGNLIVSGTQGYAYVPAPWWKTDYFELRYENQNNNKKFFYKWDEEGLRYEIQEFISCIINNRFESSRLRRFESIAIANIMEQLQNPHNTINI